MLPPTAWVAVKMLHSFVCFLQQLGLLWKWEVMYLPVVLVYRCQLVWGSVICVDCFWHIFHKLPMYLVLNSLLVWPVCVCAREREGERERETCPGAFCVHTPHVHACLSEKGVSHCKLFAPNCQNYWPFPLLYLRFSTHTHTHTLSLSLGVISCQYRM